MEPVDNVARTIEALRREMARNIEKLRQDGKISPQQVPASPSRSAPSLRKTTARALKSLDPNDAQFAEKAIGSFVESVLLNEFGAELVNDADFRHLIRQVQLAMMADATMAQELGLLVRQLVSE